LHEVSELALFVAVARPTLSVDRLLCYSFKTPKVACDCLKVGRDEVDTHFQIVARHFGRRKRIAARRTASVAQLQQTHDN